MSSWCSLMDKAPPSPWPTPGPVYLPQVLGQVLSTQRGLFWLLCLARVPDPGAVFPGWRFLPCKVVLWLCLLDPLAPRPAHGATRVLSREIPPPLFLGEPAIMAGNLSSPTPQQGGEIGEARGGILQTGGRVEWRPTFFPPCIGGDAPSLILFHCKLLQAAERIWRKKGKK